MIPTGLSSVVAEDIAEVVRTPLPWKNLSSSTILVTGASGFLPAYMIETLVFLNRNFNLKTRILALARSAERVRERFAAYADRGEIEFLIQDVSDPLKFEGDLDFIVHAASQASPRYYSVDPTGTLSANVLGTWHLLSAAAKQRLRGFLFFSSGDVYGIPNSSRPVTETDYGYLDPTNIRSCYGESKRMGETMCVSWAHQFGVPARIVRPFHTYGPGMRLDDGRIFADFVRDILGGGPLVLLSDGSARRCFCYLSDATAGFFAVLLEGTTGQAYNVANPDQEYSIAELADRLAVVFRDRDLKVERRQRADSVYVASPVPVTRPDISKIQALGWNPRVSIETGFLRTVRSYGDGEAVQTREIVSA